MLVKEMSSRINNKIIFIFVFIVILFSFNFAKANENESEISNYFLKLESFSASFIQTDGNSLEEGMLYIGDDRLRVEYKKPSKILLIMDRDKAMYHNYDLNETEFFNPENTSAWIFLELFKNKDFFQDMSKVIMNKNIILSKKQIINEINYNLEIHF
jgi:Outer membrane lipoprotein-sorting protein